MKVIRSVRRPIIGLLVVLLVAIPAAGIAQQVLPPIDHLFRLESYERRGDGYDITVANTSNRAFTDVTIVVLGTDINRATIYRREIHPAGLFEGQSERTFHISGNDADIFRLDIEVYDSRHPPKRIQ